MSKNELIAAAEGRAAASSEWDLRGRLAASLTCWHRLTGKEADELVALFQGRAYAAPQGVAYAALPKPVYQWTDGSRTLQQDVVSAIRDYADSSPETGEDWESWFEAAFDLLVSRVNEIFEEHALRASHGQAPVGAKPDDQIIAEYGIKASRMMARDLTRFDAACEVDKYLRDQGAPMYYRHRMSIVLFGNTEGTDAARAPDNAPQPSPWDPQHTTAHGRTVPPPPFPPAPPRSTPLEAADLKTAAKLEMADEYQRWIDHFHKGGDYDGFLRIELAAKERGV